MNFDSWMAYAVACAVLSVIPGPSVLLISGQALTKGLRAALVCLVGEILGGSILIILSLLGVGALLAASTVLFVAVKWLGVAYLAYLGLRQIWEANKQGSSPDEVFAEPEPNIRGSFSSGFLTALLNPKAIVFYMAFLSQFFDPSRNHLLQYTILIVTSAVVAGAILAMYAVAASRAQKLLSGNRAQRNFAYTSGGFYLGGSMWMATTR